MEIALTVLSQVGIMFLLILVGVFACKKGMISIEGGAQFSELLLMIVTPAVIINAFQIDFKPNLAKGLLFSLVLAVLSHVVGIIVSVILIKKQSDSRQYSVERFASIYGNASFLGIPLISAVFPQNGVFYASAFLAVFNLFIWTHGISLMSGKIGVKDMLKVLKSPTIISIVLGLTMFLTSFKLPEVIGSAVGYISNLNTPLAMIVLGIYIARSKLLTAFIDKRIYIVVAIRLLLVPLIVTAIMMFIPSAGENKTIMMASLIASACPTAATTLLIANRFRSGTDHASRIIAVTTVFSILTMPIIMLVADKLIGVFAK